MRTQRIGDRCQDGERFRRWGEEVAELEAEIVGICGLDDRKYEMRRIR